MKKLVGWLFFLALATFFILNSSSTYAASATAVFSPYFYNFNSAGVLNEAASADLSGSAYWWVNSGAYLKVNNGRGSTNMGALPADDRWRLLYNANNSGDTDKGYHPQNIFRLLTRSVWGDAREEAYFVIRKNNLSESANRNASNGLLLFNRYQNGDNLYYTGVRVDGSAIIKKKKDGIYYTLAEVKGVYPGAYNRNSNPNLLPENKWIGLRSEVKNLGAGAVEIKLFIDKGWQGNWVLAAEATDDGKKYGGAAFTAKGFGGIRTDFVDAEFENFRFRDI